MDFFQEVRGSGIIFFLISGGKKSFDIFVPSKNDFKSRIRKDKSRKKINLVFFSFVIGENPVLTTVLEKSSSSKQGKKVDIYFELQKN